MPMLRISDTTFADIKELASWFGTKTPIETIDRIVKETMEHLGMERDDGSFQEITLKNNKKLEFTETPELAFTKPVSVFIDNTCVNELTWTGVLIRLIEIIKSEHVSRDDLIRSLSLPIRMGIYEEQGFRYLPKMGISLQRQPAQESWKEIERLAKKWKISVKIEFLWRLTKKAQHPGCIGIICA